MGKVRVPISQVLPIRWVLLDFFVLWKIDGKTHAFLIWWRYTTGWESNGKKAPIQWEKYEYQFPRPSPYDGFCCIFPYYKKLMGKPMHFPYDEVYHRMGIKWEKSTHTMGKVWLRISQVYDGFCCIFQYYEKLVGKDMHFPYDENIPNDGSRMGKKYPYYGKSMSTNFPGFFLIWWVLLLFSVLWWEIDGKTHAFHIWWIYHRMGIRWEKTTHTMGKVPMITNFPGSPDTMGFVAFSHAMGNWCENPSISHIMRFVNFFLSRTENPGKILEISEKARRSKGV